MVLTWSQWKKYSEKSYPEKRLNCAISIEWVTVCEYHNRFAWPVFCYWKLIRKKIVSLLFTIGFVWFVVISPAIPAKQSDSS